MIKCGECGQFFKNQKGLHIHEGRMHKEGSNKISKKTYAPGVSALDLSIGKNPKSKREGPKDKNISRRMYAVVEWARAAVDAVCRSCTSAGYHLSVKDYAKDMVSQEELYIISRFFDLVNEEDHFEDLLWDVVVDLFVFGNAYLEVPRGNKFEKFMDDFKKGNLNVAEIKKFPVRMYVVDAEYMEPKTDGQKITKYTLEKNGKVLQTWNDPKEIIHFKFPGPGTDVKGMSPFKTLFNTMATDINSGKYNSDFFKNNSTPRLHIDLGNVGQDELDAFVARANKQLKGKPHSSLVTTGEATVEPISLKNKDMEFSIYTERIRQRILSVLGVQPAILGLVDDIREVQHQIALFINLTIKPIQRLIARRINRKVIEGVFEVPAELVFNPITELDVDSYVRQMEAELKNCVSTVNEYRRSQGRPDVDWGDRPLVPYTNLEQAMLPEQGEENQEEEENEQKDEGDEK